MHDTEREALALRAFPTATRIILAAIEPGGKLFHDAEAAREIAGSATTGSDAETSVPYRRHLWSQ